MKIYMDNCCYYRPFDDQTQDRILIETDAVLSVISRCDTGDWKLLGSEVLDYEISKVKDAAKFQKADMLYKAAKTKILLTPEIKQRANELQQYGIKSMDALHLSSAESGGADVYLTTDDNLIKCAKASNTKMNVTNPVHWIMEVMKNE